MAFINVRMREYVTQHEHVGIQTYPVGTACFAARLPSDKVVLTFENESIVLGDKWWLPGLEQPRIPILTMIDKMAQSIYEIEDAAFLAYLDECIKALQTPVEP